MNSNKWVLTTQHIKHIYHIVDLFMKRRRIPLSNQDDYRQEAVIGAMRAEEKFNPKMGVKYATYCTYWVNATISKYNQKRNIINNPYHESTDINRQPRAEISLYSLDIDPSDEGLENTMVSHDTMGCHDEAYQSKVDNIDVESIKSQIRQAMSDAGKKEHHADVYIKYLSGSKILHLAKEYGVHRQSMSVKISRLSKIGTALMDKIRNEG